MLAKHAGHENVCHIFNRLEVGCAKAVPRLLCVLMEQGDMSAGLEH